MAGRRSAGAETDERTPWETRQLAARKLGKIRRAITDEAMGGQLPSDDQRSEYLRAESEFEGAQAFWLASRGAPSGA